ncbi:MAG: Glucose-6-phosphate isomerase [Streblomastix strix]|uniref:Glucose-6-phosphate isomerase n=2 Tax=Streblomastix strix TaxID=222440 RepID=A0A5J4WY43_9EUKA|nr:MAG: Glucose-6-phosphate isomerase [Streblomastix strix]
MEPLLAHKGILEKQKIAELFDKDPHRVEKFSLQIESGDDFLYLDYSKNLITEETIDLLVKYAEENEVAKKIEAMFNGDIINITEKRAVLHTALRNRSNRPIYVDGKDVMPDVNAVLEKVRIFVQKIRSGEWKGYTGKQITDVVNIGIGGSDLGPSMVSKALTPYADRSLIRAHYISNVDGTHAVEVLRELNPETVLFIISSKTFTTQETMNNAQTCKNWWLSKVGEVNASQLPKHFVAVSTNLAKVAEFGINPENAFAFWDWVGGRFSLWSAIGLSTAIYVGYDNFIQLLEGAHSLDEHFRTQHNLKKNIPVILALLNIWNGNFFGFSSHAVLPYDQYLELFPAFLQQLEMESNGKGVKIATGEKVGPFGTGGVVWGQPGTNGQHAFYQLIHQGTQVIPCTFIFPIRSHNPIGFHHTLLASNVFAQSEALMRGKTEDEAWLEGVGQSEGEEHRRLIAKHRTFPGNRPSNTILLNQVTPRTLGILIALYENKVFVEGVIWKINSFDQWGVELGKQLANQLFSVLSDKDGTNEEAQKRLLQKDQSTRTLVDIFKKFRQ